MRSISFEDGLATLFQRDNGGDILDLMALGEIGGLADRIPRWLRTTEDETPRTMFWSGPLANRPIKEVDAFWRIVFEGDASAINNAIGTDQPDLTAELIRPLVLLGRGDVVVALHDRLLARGNTDISQGAAVALGKSGDWEHAIAVLERAHRGGANPRFYLATEDMLWKQAYLQGQVDTVLPRLAAIPFNRHMPHAESFRKWQLVAYQIRAGRSDVCVPAIEPDEQTHGYVEAALMQIADLEGDPSEARTVRELRRVVHVKPITMQIVAQGTSFQTRNFADELLKAQVKIAARRKDYAKAAALARSATSDPLVQAPELLIDAFLDEGDWRAAAETAQRHDARDRPPLEDFDDCRSKDYLTLQSVLATAAARNGDHADAHGFLVSYANALSSGPQDEAAEYRLNEFYPWMATILAGTAEGALPRRSLPLLLPTFRTLI